MRQLGIQLCFLPDKSGVPFAIFDLARCTQLALHTSRNADELRSARQLF
jgi:hypothetical protein